MKKRLLGFALSMLLCLSLAVPALAADTAPDISITWLSVEGQPRFYNRDLNWLTIRDDDYSYTVIDLETGKRINDYDFALEFSEGLAMVGKEDADGNRKFGYIDKTGAVVVPLEYDDAGYLSDGMFWVQKGVSYGIFESPYYKAEEEGDNIVTDVIDKATGKSGNSGGFPVVPVMAAAAAVAAAAVLVVKKKRGTVPAGAGNARKTAEGAAEKLTSKPVKSTCSCGAENDPGAKFCQRCGKPVAAPGQCPSCGRQNDPAAKFCQSCGKPLNGGED